MSAQRLKKRKESKKKIKLYFYYSIILLIGLLLFFWFRKSDIWNGKRLIVVAYPNRENTTVLVGNPDKEELYKIDIPNDTQINIVGNGGEWKLGSLWELGYSRKQGGKLAVETIVKNFSIPAYAWGSKNFDAFYQGGVLSLFKPVIFSEKTNLDFIERFKLAKLSLKIKDVNKYYIKLDETEFLQTVKLSDGSDGYVITQNIPIRLLPIMSMFPPEKAITLSIVNVSGQNYLVDRLAAVIESMGAKVISKTPSELNDYPADTDCIIEGNRQLAVYIEKVFSCSISDKTISGGSDMVMVIGEKFIDRF